MEDRVIYVGKVVKKDSGEYPVFAAIFDNGLIEAVYYCDGEMRYQANGRRVYRNVVDTASFDWGEHDKQIHSVRP